MAGSDLFRYPSFHSGVQWRERDSPAFTHSKGGIHPTQDHPSFGGRGCRAAYNRFRARQRYRGVKKSNPDCHFRRIPNQSRENQSTQTRGFHRQTMGRNSAGFQEQRSKDCWSAFPGGAADPKRGFPESYSQGRAGRQNPRGLAAAFRATSAIDCLGRRWIQHQLELGTDNHEGGRVKSLDLKAATPTRGVSRTDRQHLNFRGRMVFQHLLTGEESNLVLILSAPKPEKCTENAQVNFFILTADGLTC